MIRSKRGRALILAAGVALVGGIGFAQEQPLDSGTVMAAVEKLRPGEYIWVPQIAPQGPMLVVVNLATQRLVAYRNGVPIAVSTISSGKPGKRTPTGVFTILQKRVHHRSSTYNNAPMPYMQRLTWSGVALHGGTLPGYPASHGCVRLPHEFARLLFQETAMGMTVVVVNQPGELRIGAAPQQPGPRPYNNEPSFWRPELSPYGPVSIVVSAADRRMVVLRNGVEIGSAPVSFEGVVDRVQAYVLRDVSGGRYHWTRVALPGQDSAGSEAATEGDGRFQGAHPFREALATVVGPGTTMVVIPDSLGLGASSPEQRIPAPTPLIEDDPTMIARAGNAREAAGR